MVAIHWIPDSTEHGVVREHPCALCMCAYGERILTDVTLVGFDESEALHPVEHDLGLACGRTTSLNRPLSIR